MRVAVGLAGLFVVGCGGTTIGHPCTVSQDCQNGQICLTAAPGGSCVKGCAIEGDTKSCPGGTVCATQMGGLYCSATCGGQGDCRDDYQCSQVNGSTLQACTSKLP